uniref:ATPase inhibitor, mitochondrial n=1 Tax=Globodera rostochiensis TaxID=31243 RepID=A0A914I826_GLORO
MGSFSSRISWMASQLGDLGGGSGRGGGSGGAVRDAGGALGKMEVAREKNTSTNLSTTTEAAAQTRARSSRRAGQIPSRRGGTPQEAHPTVGGGIERDVSGRRQLFANSDTNTFIF